MEGNGGRGCCGTLRLACVRVQDTRCVDSLSQLRWPGPIRESGSSPAPVGLHSFFFLTLTLTPHPQENKQAVFITQLIHSTHVQLRICFPCLSVLARGRDLRRHLLSLRSNGFLVTNTNLLRDHDFDNVYTLSGVPLRYPVVNIESL